MSIITLKVITLKAAFPEPFISGSALGPSGRLWGHSIYFRAKMMLHSDFCLLKMMTWHVQLLFKTGDMLFFFFK